MAGTLDSLTSGGASFEQQPGASVCGPADSFLSCVYKQTRQQRTQSNDRATHDPLDMKYPYKGTSESSGDFRPDPSNHQCLVDIPSRKLTRAWRTWLGFGKFSAAQFAVVQWQLVGKICHVVVSSKTCVIALGTGSHVQLETALNEMAGAFPP